MVRMLVKHFMTTKVFTLRPEQTVLKAFQELKKRSIRRAPVLEQGEVIGIVSERDLAYILPGTAAQALTYAGGESMDLPVREVMSTPVKTIGPDRSLAGAAFLMLEHKIGGIPVVEENRLRGIITESDIFRAVWGILSAESGCRVIIQGWSDPPNDSADYFGLCERHGCRIRNLLHYSASKHTGFSLLTVQGEDIDGLIDDLRARAERVLVVPGPDPAGSDPGPGGRPGSADRKTRRPRAVLRPVRGR
jgi:acetoin utilization protein AcuB